MFKVTKTQKRTTTEHPFHYEVIEPSDEYKSYVLEKYLKTKKLLSNDRELSEDQLTLTTVSTWDNQESFIEFVTDRHCLETYLNKVNEHDEKVGIQINLWGEEPGGDPIMLGEGLQRKINIEDLYKDIEIPDDWDTIEDFVNWYINARFPLIPPWDSEIIRSDDATALCMFRKGAYQVELYLEFPGMYIKRHSHPGVELVIMELGCGGRGVKGELGASDMWGTVYKKLTPGSWHGGEKTMALSEGVAILAFEKWHDPSKMTSAAIQWVGELHGPLQAELIKKHHKDAYVVDGYADITKTRGE